ncbi:uncharacterized protein LOC122246039 [Penaeus japonicus]|uniref:uncharacterized protein LOC122246039 n=1 Tax=Penaeus japonicus TaxID=27405 RepID=UPI001C70EF3A|nr:uncharacterized protein LOC122246039 [Penaeus japonicus]XP_042860223.1 uncharacterized protein LOC122246039 [Penaeus japonicus]
MSTSVAPVIDQENPVAQRGAKMKTHMGLGVRNANGSSQGLAVHNQKKFTQSSSMSHVKPRSFGDISNRMGKVNESIPGSAMKKTQKQHVLATPLQQILVQKPVADPEPEFFPEISEKEDYSDIFPASLNLSNQHIGKLVRFWEVCRRPELSSLSPSKIPKSPPRPFSLMSVMREPEKEINLEPVMDEMFDLPPPAWE